MYTVKGLLLLYTVLDTVLAAQATKLYCTFPTTITQSMSQENNITLHCRPPYLLAASIAYGFVLAPIFFNEI